MRLIVSAHTTACNDRICEVHPPLKPCTVSLNDNLKERKKKVERVGTDRDNRI